MMIARFLEQNGFGELYNLNGGMTAWSREIDPSVPIY
jgi:rhodanese-related sulfurtransferase